MERYSLQVDQLVQKVIPQQIIPERTIVVFAEQNNNV